MLIRRKILTQVIIRTQKNDSVFFICQNFKNMIKLICKISYILKELIMLDEILENVETIEELLEELYEKKRIMDACEAQKKNDSKVE